MKGSDIAKETRVFEKSSELSNRPELFDEEKIREYSLWLKQLQVKGLGSGCNARRCTLLLEKYAANSIATEVINNAATKIIEKIANDLFDVVRPLKSKKRSNDLLDTVTLSHWILLWKLILMRDNHCLKSV